MCSQRDFDNTEHIVFASVLSTYPHANGPRDKCGLASPTVDPEDCWNGSYPHDDTYNSRRKKRGRFAVQTERGKNERSVVKDEVDASPLLESHYEDGYSCPLEVASFVEQR